MCYIHTEGKAKKVRSVGLLVGYFPPQINCDDGLVYGIKVGACVCVGGGGVLKRNILLIIK